MPLASSPLIIYPGEYFKLDGSSDAPPDILIILQDPTETH